MIDEVSLNIQLLVGWSVVFKFDTEENHLLQKNTAVLKSLNLLDSEDFNENFISNHAPKQFFKGILHKCLSLKII